MNKILIIGLFIFLFFASLLYTVNKRSLNSLFFEVPAFSYEEISISVENEPVIKEGNILIPITLTTTRPVTITVAGTTHQVKIDRLAKDYFLPVNIAFKDKKIQYLLQTLPKYFPNFSTHNSSDQKGFVFISMHGLALTDPSYSFISDMDGHVVFYRGHPKIRQSMFHLKKVTLLNGKIRYITHVQDGWGLDKSYIVGYHLIMDENFHELDRVKLLKTDKHDALLADEHDILMLDDGHYILIGQDTIETILPDNNKSLITHQVIQEQKNGQVLLDWDSKDYPELQKACYEKCPELHSYNADYIHVNSLFIDPTDDNLIVSSASGYFIMKLDRKNGNILWILGGKANQFQIPKEAEFVRQHSVHRLDDGRLIMFDNHFPSLSKLEMQYHNRLFNYQPAQILILDLDEKNKSVKSFEKIPLNFLARYMGSVQKLSDNRWLIGCGSSNTCTARMIDRSGHILWNMKAAPPYKMFRAYWYESLK